jgi:threonine dehydratase
MNRRPQVPSSAAASATASPAPAAATDSTASTAEGGGLPGPSAALGFESSQIGPSFEAIEAAHRRIAPHIHRTPVMSSSSLDHLAGAKLYFKCENLQRSGSFKMRGASNAVFSLRDEEAARGVVTHSSGNHAAALALAARERGIHTWIVMPSDAPLIKRRAVEAFGGEIMLCEPTMAAREAAAAELMQRTGAVLLHPFDDDRIIAGQATAAVELLEEIPDLDFVLAPVSGGGLLSGTAIASKHLRAAAQVVGCEPRNADDAARSVAAGRLEPAAQAKTIADGLRATLAPRTLAILRRHVAAFSLVTEEEIVAAMRLLWDRLKLIVEPSGAVAAAPALFRKLGVERNSAPRKVGIILSGGNLDLEALPFGRPMP